jgi:hypothetical protein
MQEILPGLVIHVQEQFDSPVIDHKKGTRVRSDSSSDDPPLK